MLECMGAFRPVRCQLFFAVAAAMALWLPVQPSSAGEWPVGGMSGVQLAWREDPRMPGDGPGGPAAPSVRGQTRRAQRRAAVYRRRQPEDPGEQFPGALDDDPFIRCHPQDVPPICPLPNRLVLPIDSPGMTATARHRFDLHKPTGAPVEGLPLVIWIPGESWRDVARGDCPVAWLAEEGYAVASIGYRPSDVAAFPAQLDDCRAAIAAIVRHADAWGIDPGRIVVAGGGGGGHLAALVALLDEPATETGWPGVAAVCAVGAPTNLATLGPEHDRSGSAASRLIGGPLPEYREKARFASPITHVTPDDPPVLIVHGAADPVVLPRQAFEFDAALKAAGVDSALVILPGVGRRPALGRGTPAGQSLLAFLGRTIGQGIPVATGSDAAVPPP